MVVLSHREQNTPVFQTFYKTPFESDEVTTFQSRPLYDQAQPGGADWRSILKDIQEKRKQLRDKQISEETGEITNLETEEFENQNEKHQDSDLDQSASSSDTTASKVSKRASAALLSKVKQSNRLRAKSGSNVQKFGRFRKQFLSTRSFFHQYPDSNRFEGDESWRSPDVFPDSPVVLRPIVDENQVLDAAAAAVAAAENSGNGAAAASYLSAANTVDFSKSKGNNAAGSSIPLGHKPAAKSFLPHDRQREVQQQILNSKVSRSQHLQQYLSNDFGENTDRIFLLVKTGFSMQWDRLPAHFFTTFTRFPNFGIYSDAASSMAGYEIIDILQDLPTKVLQDHQLGLYLEQQKARQAHAYTRPSPPKDERPWIMDKFKTLPMLQHAWKHAPDNDWYMLIDDDSYVLSDNVGRWLATLDPNKPYYLGSAVAGLKHVFAHGGSGIVLSRGLMELAFGHDDSDAWVDEYSEQAIRECCGDYILAAFLKEKLDINLNLSISGKKFQGEDFTHIAFNKQNWCSDIVSFHHTYSRNMELLWEYERIRSYARRAHSSYVFSPEDAVLAAKTRPSITYGDIYTDFVKPYLTPMKSMWDNGAKEVEFSWFSEAAAGRASVEDYLRNDGYSDKPYTSVDKCRQACLARADCLMFRYDPYQKYCGYSSSVSFGQPKTAYQDADIRRLLKHHGIIQSPRTNDESMYSEWRFDRIENMRKNLACDPPPENEEFDDGNEGWYWRAREKSPDSLLETVKQNK